MLKAVFGNCPEVKTMDFLLSTYEGRFNKTQLANGSEISRPTLNKFIKNFIKYNLINEVGENLFELNRDSKVIKFFEKSNILLAEIQANIQMQNNRNIKNECSNKEIDEILSDIFDEEDLSEEEHQEKIAKEEKILVNKKEHEKYRKVYEKNIITPNWDDSSSFGKSYIDSEKKVIYTNNPLNNTNKIVIPNWDSLKNKGA